MKSDKLSQKRRTITILVLFLAALIFKDFLIRSTLQAGAGAAGIKLKIDHFHVGILNSHVWARDIFVSSPRGFQDDPMFKINSLFANLSPFHLLLGQARLHDLVIHLDEVWFVRNKDSNMNLALIKLPAAPVKIDAFELKLDRVVYKDHGTPIAAVERSFDVSIHEKNVDVSDLKDINGVLSTIFLKAARNAAFARLFNFNPKDLVKDNVLALVTSKNLVSDAASAVADVVAKPFSETSEEKLEKTEQKIKETAVEIDDGKASLKETKTEMKETIKVIDEKKEVLEEKSKELDTTIAKVDKAKENLEAEEQKLEEEKKKIDDEKKKADELKKQAEEKEGLLSAITGTAAEKLEEKIEVKKAALEEKETQLKEAKEEIKKEAKEIKKIEKDVKSHANEVAALESDVVKKEETLEKVKEEIESTKEKLAETKEKAEDLKKQE